MSKRFVEEEEAIVHSWPEAAYMISAPRPTATILSTNGPQ
jgi:hypothetical protein